MTDKLEEFRKEFKPKSMRESALFELLKKREDRCGELERCLEITMAFIDMNFHCKPEDNCAECREVVAPIRKAAGLVLHDPEAHGHLDWGPLPTDGSPGTVAPTEHSPHFVVKGLAAKEKP